MAFSTFKKNLHFALKSPFPLMVPIIKQRTNTLPNKIKAILVEFSEKETPEHLSAQSVKRTITQNIRGIGLFSNRADKLSQAEIRITANQSVPAKNVNS